MKLAEPEIIHQFSYSSNHQTICLESAVLRLSKKQLLQPLVFQHKPQLLLYSASVEPSSYVALDLRHSPDPVVGREVGLRSYSVPSEKTLNSYTWRVPFEQPSNAVKVNLQIEQMLVGRLIFLEFSDYNLHVG